jgi:putative flippase GtrA
MSILKKILSRSFARFLLIGTLNTILDFGIVNFLAFIFQAYQGKTLVLINTLSFVIVVTISFFLNKNWTFRSEDGNQQPAFAGRKYIIFFLTTAIGLVLNNIIIYLLTTIIGPRFGLTEIIWLNVSKAIAVGVVLFWNFFNYKYLVFKRN